MCSNHTNSSRRVVLEWSWGVLEPSGGETEGNETNLVTEVGMGGKVCEKGGIRFWKVAPVAPFEPRFRET